MLLFLLVTVRLNRNYFNLCFLLKVSPRTLVRYRNSGLLPFKTIKRRNFYLESDVHIFIRNHFDKGKVQYPKIKKEK